eukprot:GHRR01033941.1.p1 GENE.GHRR01033941.1~~GHRR01033941.1.p1  ORF type:complete len:228 (+),score=50.69 GHRR01033941.1:112-795(+)
MAGEKGSIVWDVLYSRHDSLFADRVMKEEDWSRLRRATYRHKLQPCKLARVMLGYFWILVYVAVLTVAVGLYSSIAVQYYGWPMLSLQSVQTFFSAITFALTLLLVFKTNSSYARWWEARKDVGQLVSCAHNLVRQVCRQMPCQKSQPRQQSSLGRLGKAACSRLGSNTACARMSQARQHAPMEVGSVNMQRRGKGAALVCCCKQLLWCIICCIAKLWQLCLIPSPS